MAFRVSPKTLERLEWSQLVERWAEHAHTPLGRAWLLEAGDELFAPDLTTVRERLAETAEARALLEEGAAPPLGAVREVGAALARAGRGGVLGPADLAAIGHTLLGARDVGRALAAQRETAPLLAERAEPLGMAAPLGQRLAGSFDAEGELRDDASPALAEARRDSRRLAAQAVERMQALLRDGGIAEALSDRFYTVRNDRYVLPVRADRRARVPGIVHDASASGTTLFVEPERLIELNNRHKQAELSVVRETRRILRELSDAVAAERDAIEAELEALLDIDLAFARARLAVEQGASSPEVGEAGVIVLPQLRHPLLPAEEVVPNDLRLGESFHVLVVSGPNAGGKTVAMKAMALAALGVRAGLEVPAAAGSRLDPPDALLADIGDEQDLRQSLSTFSAHIANLAAIVREADARSLVVLDEVGVGTDPGEGAALAQAVLEALAERGARVVATTHYNLLKEIAAVDERFENASVEFEPETLAPTYRLQLGTAGASSARAVAARMGMPAEVLARADALLEREDRQLDQMLAELQSNRVALDRERREAEALRAETESARDAYRHKLERLEERRQALFASMRSDLDRAFRSAHDEVAGVIRELQRKGTAQEAARAREKLIDLAERARDAEVDAATAAPQAAPAAALDWAHARPGDPVGLPGGGTGVLRELPDRRGRAVVQAGTARLTLAAEQLTRPEPEASPAPRKPRVRLPNVERLPAAERRCDLRGLRVDEAIDRLIASLDAAAARGDRELEIVHGIGTGALSRAVREHLNASPYVLHYERAPDGGGGDGVTLARLSD